MGVEERRKKLMTTGHSWGGLPYHVPGSREGCECVEASTSDASTLDALTIYDMNNAVEPPPLHPISRISTNGWSLEQILRSGRRFHPISRVFSSSLTLTKEINKSERTGAPLIIEGLHNHSGWLRHKFHPEWLMAHGVKDISVRNVHDWSDKIIPLPEFIAKSRASPQFAPQDEQERLYGKDAECPEEWNEWLHTSKVVPASLTPNNPENLLSSHVETLMCYLGIGDTFTPCHKDLCASSGQNLMCYTENGGSSFWFMTRSSDAPGASRYFQKLKQELDHETHVITIEQLTKAPFDIFIGEQQLGDLVLVPPRSCHQVVNYGGITIKTSWSRMTLKGLETAYYHELPIYRRVCRNETYRVKSTIYQTLRKRTADLAKSRRRNIHSQALLTDSRSDNMMASMRALLKLVDAILLEEYSPAHGKMHCLSSTSSASSGSSDTSDDHADSDFHVTCDFCGADVFQSFFECLDCVTSKASGSRKIAHGDGFVVCAGCYVEGRSCKCTIMEPIQCRPFGELLSCRNKAAEVLSANTGADTFPPLETCALSSGMGTFRAACLLEQIRKEKRDNKVCTLPSGNESTHTVPFPWALTCKKCHIAKCFTHILMSQKLHAVDALLIHSSDPSHEQHHHRHRTSRYTFEGEREAFLLSQQQGTKPNLSQQRTHIALEYGTCKPINPEYMSLGWYDMHAHILTIAPDQDYELAEDASRTSVSDPSVTVSPPPSTFPQVDSTSLPPLPIQKLLPEPTTTTTVPKIAISASHKRKRMLLDYVDIPVPAYRIKRPSRPTSNTIETGSPNTPEENVTNLQSVSDEPPTSASSTELINTQQGRDTMQTDSNGHPILTTEDPITTKDPGVTPDANSPINLTSTSLPISTSAITAPIPPIQPPNPKPRRESRFSTATPCPSSCSSNTLDTSRTRPDVAPGCTSNATINSPEIVGSASGRPNNSRPQTFSTSAGRSSNTTEVTAEHSWERGPGARKTNATFSSLPQTKRHPSKKITRATKRVPPAAAISYQSSSSSTYPRSTSPEGLAQALNRATTNNYRMLDAIDTTGPAIAHAVSNNNQPQPSAAPVSDESSNQLIKHLFEELVHLKNEVKSIRQHLQPQPPQTPLNQAPQFIPPPGSSPDFMLGVMTAMRSLPGHNLSLPPQIPYWPQQCYQIPPPTRQEPEYYPPPAMRERWEPLERERHYEVPYINEARPSYSARPGPERDVYYAPPRRENYRDDNRKRRVIYERGIDADAGKYGPRSRSTRGVTQERHSPARQVAKYEGPYSRPDHGWRRDQVGQSNIDVIRRTRSLPERASSRFDPKNRSNKQGRGYLRRHSPRRNTPPGSATPLPTPTSSIDNRSKESFPTNPPTPPPPSQPVPIPVYYQGIIHQSEGANIRSRSQTLFDARSEPFADWRVRDRRSRPQTPLTARPEPSIHWEDDYEQEEAAAPQDQVFKEPPRRSRSRSVQSYAPNDLTVNPWN